MSGLSALSAPDPGAKSAGANGAPPRGEDPAAAALLAEAGRRLTGMLNLRRCVRTVLDVAVTHLADAAVVVRPPVLGHATVVRLTASGGAQEHSVPERDLESVPALAEALTAYPPGPVQWLKPSADLDQLTGDPKPADGWLLCPLPGHAEPAGALLLRRRTGRADVNARDEALLDTFAVIAGSALAAAELYRIQVDAMAVLQAELRLPPLPRIPGVELAASHQPGDDGMLVGGDFYDAYLPTLPERHPVVVLGDVAGKGAAAAGLAGRVRQTLRTVHLLGHDPVAMLHTLNTVLLQPGESDRFVTLVIVTVRPVPGGGVRLTAATGGHPAPLVLRGDGMVQRLPITGTLVGALPKVTATPAEVTLAPGELCLLYSDGMLEGRNAGSGPRYGDHRLRQALGTCRGMPARVAVERLRQLVGEWVRGRVPDDMVMLAIRAPAGAGPGGQGHAAGPAGVGS